MEAAKDAESFIRVKIDRIYAWTTDIKIIYFALRRSKKRRMEYKKVNFNNIVLA